jgi:hypothetical protein
MPAVRKGRAALLPALLLLIGCTPDIPPEAMQSSFYSSSPMMLGGGGFVEGMEGVPLFPGAEPVEQGRPYNAGYRGGSADMQAVYAVRQPLSAVLRFYRANLTGMGWNKHPDYEVYERGGRQIYLQAFPRAGYTYIRYRTGNLISPAAWQQAYARRQDAYVSHAGGGRKDDEDE